MTTVTAIPRTLSANEAAHVTGVPLRQVHRNRHGDSGQRRGTPRGIPPRPLRRPGGPEARPRNDNDLHSRRTPAPCALPARPSEAESDCVHDVSVDVPEMKEEVRRGLSRLGRARETFAVDETVLSGTPCVKGTRIPAHDIAEMFANGDSVEAIVDAWPGLTLAQIDAAACYARGYPRRGRPRNAPA